MDCQQVQDAIFEALGEEWKGPGTTADAAAAERRRLIDAHVAVCPSCAAFAARQQALDARLGALLAPPELSPSFRPALRRQIQRERAQGWIEALPDILHLASFGVVTLIGVLVLPFDAVAVVGVGTTATALTYLLLTAVRNSLEDA